MSDPDLDVTDETLGEMRHDGLVALLNRLYARCGEPALKASTAHASSDDELRDSIRGVRRRLLAKARRTPESVAPARPPTDRPRPTPPRGAASPARRAFVVLVSHDQALARRARANCSARGVVLVWVASETTLAKLASSVTPTHVVIEGLSDRIDEASVRALAARGVEVHWCRGADEALEALAQIE
jgi:hypothetical protein